MNTNLNTNSAYEPTQALNDALNRFDATITATFGDELGSIEHFCYTDELSFTTVRFADHGYIYYNVRPDSVTDGGFETSGERLMKGYKAFGIMVPDWCYRF